MVRGVRERGYESMSNGLGAVNFLVRYEGNNWRQKWFVVGWDGRRARELAVMLG
jgi:hypothetical protein